MTVSHTTVILLTQHVPLGCRYRSFYANHFIPKMPADVKLTPIDRTVAKDTIVDEFIFEFTHDRTMDWMLPGIVPTGKKVRVPFVVVVKFEGDKVRVGVCGRCNNALTGWCPSATNCSSMLTLPCLSCLCTAPHGCHQH
jgi:hypothetical protein